MDEKTEDMYKPLAYGHTALSSRTPKLTMNLDLSERRTQTLPSVSFSSSRTPGTDRGTALSANCFYWRPSLICIAVCWLPCLELSPNPSEATVSVSFSQNTSQLLALIGVRGRLWIKTRVRAQLQIEASPEVYNWLEAIHKGLWYGRDWSWAPELGFLSTPVNPPPTAINRMCYPPRTMAQRISLLLSSFDFTFKNLTKQQFRRFNKHIPGHWVIGERR